MVRNKIESFYSNLVNPGVLSVFVVPIIFTIFALLCLYNIDKSLTYDGYLHLISSHAILDGYGYIGEKAYTYPPLHSLLVSFLGLSVNLTHAAKIITILSFASLLAIFPFISNHLSGSYLPGICVQLILAFSNELLAVSTQIDNVPLNAFLISFSLLVGFRYLENDQPTQFPVWFSILSTLACLNRYMGWALILAFCIAVLTDQKIASRVSVATKTFLIPLLGTIPSFLYKYFTLGIVFSSTEWKIIGVSFIENNLMDMNFTEWFIIHSFEYNSFFDFISRHPYEFFWNFILSSIKIINLLFYNYTALGHFSWTAGVGLIVMAFKSFEKTKFRFLSIFVILCGTISTLTITNWFYFLPIVPILSVIGISFIYKSPQETNFIAWKNQLLAGTVIVLITLGCFFLQYNRQMKSIRNLLKNNFLSRNMVYRSGTLRLVQNKLTEFKNSLNRPGSVKIMSLLLANEVYLAGFKTVFPPVEASSYQRLLCYKNLSEKNLKLVENMNYPLGLDTKNYIPPDYILSDPYFSKYVLKKGSINTVNLKSKLLKTKLFENVPNMRLFKVNKSSFNCGANF